MPLVEYENLTNLHLLWIVAGVASVAAYGIWQRRRALRMLADAPLLARLAPRGGTGLRVVRLTLVTLGLAALVLALIGPRWGEREQKVIRRGIDVMIVLDVSRSMLARDVSNRPQAAAVGAGRKDDNRLGRAKLWIEQDLLPALGGDRIGLICFAGVARLKCPLTSDYGFFRLALDDVNPNSVPVGGTLIGDALRLAGESFRSPVETHKLVILITDGEDHESFPVDAATSLWDKQKVEIVAVAIGDEREGARVPESAESETYVQHDGRTVWSRANFDDLRRIAAASPLNAFIPVGTRNVDLGEIYRTRIVPAARLQEYEESERVPMPSQYHWFALAALGLLLVDSLLRDGPRPTAAQVLAHRRRAA